MSYAAQSFSNVPDGRVVRIAWQNLKVSGTVFASQMGMPTEMRLEKTADRYYLCAEPIKEIETLYTDGGVLEKITLTEPVRVDVGIHAVDFSISAPYVQGEKLLLNIFGIEIAMDMESNEVRCKRAKMPLSLLGGRAEVRIIVDKCSAEIFADGVRFFIAVAAFADYNLPYFVLQKNKNIKIDRLAWHTLENIHTRKG